MRASTGRSRRPAEPHASDTGWPQSVGFLARWTDVSLEVTQCTVNASACKTHDELKLQRPHAVSPGDDAFDDDFEVSKHFLNWLTHLYMHDSAVHCQRKRLACRDCVAAKQLIQNACHLFFVLTHNFQNPGISRSQLCSGIQERAASKVGLTKPAPESTK